MSKKRGLSLEEKREHILQIFYQSQDFFLLRELEKLGPKKGVVSQTVKDVVQSLVDDDLVLKDKIGSSLRNTHYKLEADIKASKKRLAELVELRENLKKGREDSDERNSALEEMKNVERQYNALKDEMELYADNDPATLDAMSKKNKLQSLKVLLKLQFLQQIDGQCNTGARKIFLKQGNNLDIYMERLELQKI